MNHKLQAAVGLCGLASVILVVPVAIVLSWIKWARRDRHSQTSQWRARAMFVGLIGMSAAVGLLLLSVALQAARGGVQGNLGVTDISIVGGWCCLVGMLGSVVGEGTCRLPVATGSFFLIFFYLMMTPLSTLP